MGLSAKRKQVGHAELAKFISEIITQESGNILGPSQQSMVINRLKKRMFDLGDMTPHEYKNYFDINRKTEIQYLVSLLTTHHTFFFREFRHFEFILRELPDIVARAKARGDNTLKIFCAACSRGHEAYSLAMFFLTHLKEISPGMSFKILAGDIDRESVNYASNGVYPFSEIKTIPQIYLSGNMEKGTGNISQFVRVKTHLKEKCEFKIMNLMKLKDESINEKFDIILCRNAFIYFQDKDVKDICFAFQKRLYDKGVLITGLSENLKIFDLPIITLDTSVYRFKDDKSKTDINIVPKDESKEPILMDKPLSIPKPIRVLAVDDSRSVLKLLSKVFESDPDFELVGTAENGLLAEKFLENNSVDAMTLDIHMPEKDGVTYLKDNFNSSHPKVVVVSSASREDLRYAQKTLQYGASDFIEKPSLNNLEKRADEIKMKIKMSFFNSIRSVQSNPVDKEFSKKFKIENLQNKARFILGHFSNIKKTLNYLRELEGDQPPVFFFVEGNENFLNLIENEFKSLWKFKIANGENASDFANNNIYIYDFDKHFDDIVSQVSSRRISACVFGSCSRVAERKLSGLKTKQILVEDIEGVNESLKAIASDIFPDTSFSHVSTEYLAGDDE